MIRSSEANRTARVAIGSWSQTLRLCVLLLVMAVSWGLAFGSAAVATHVLKPMVAETATAVNR
ncbi:hypothetical protein [Streptomyces sp. NPDC088196]|uniref:hypothetical protein n=1 Tax=Streptomyces sp. NPDC088196 TaxID=3154868 RepID=UPI00344B96DE